MFTMNSGADQGPASGSTNQAISDSSSPFAGLFSNILVNQSVVSIENAISTKQILGEIMGMAMFLETMMGSSTSLVPLVQFQ